MRIFSRFSRFCCCHFVTVSIFLSRNSFQVEEAICKLGDENGRRKVYIHCYLLLLLFLFWYWCYWWSSVKFTLLIFWYFGRCHFACRGVGVVKWKGKVEETEEGPVLYVGIRFYSFNYFYIVCFCLSVFAFLSVSSFVFVCSNPMSFLPICLYHKVGV